MRFYWALHQTSLSIEGAGGWPDQPSNVNAVLDYFGPTDLNVIAGPDNGQKEEHIRMVIGKFLDGTIESSRSLAALANPVGTVTRKAPPFLIIHGEDDLPVPIGPRNDQSLRLAGV